MAERRMFAKTIIDSDAFIDMPVTARLLYYDLGMRADDDGFVNSPKKIMRIVGAAEDDLKVLIAKKFIIPFESGVIVIKHWKIHNYIQKDRYKATKYKEELATLSLDENSAYTCADTNCIQDVYKMDTQDRLGKDRLGKDRLGERGCAPAPAFKAYGLYNNVFLTDDDRTELLKGRTQEQAEAMIENLSYYLHTHREKSYNDHYAVMCKWERDDAKKAKEEQKSQKPSEPIDTYDFIPITEMED